VLRGGVVITLKTEESFKTLDLFVLYKLLWIIDSSYLVELFPLLLFYECLTIISKYFLFSS